MKTHTSIAAVLLSFLALGQVNAMPVDISWSDADKYRDLRSVTETRASFQQRFYKEISKHLNELSQSLPHDYKMSIDVTNVDLAGRIQLVKGQQIRVVKDMYYPNMAFKYKLLDKSGQLVASEDVQVKGTNFLLNSNSRMRNEAFPHEKKMLTEWFKKEFTQVIEKK
ncbi:DUF3016 domain-containing protein [Thalassotalea sp. M1531]|uniref:DUF3016 domain-containing protein n=1 Tax=Thalassotalea algicola TaxID=2716224 RepID=A0A7Y0Q857_9GAMM|nr:DUF3016 domain-containing protein [Thalassotalea algicola]NMP31775.1 DUF3016 domain-containing protein [Thalassotalea algicola]